MLGASRWSAEQARADLTRRAQQEGTGGLSDLAGELFAVSDLLDGSLELRRALSDSGTPAENRAAMVAQLLGDRLQPGTLQVVQGVVRLRWSEPRDLADALELLGAQAAFLVAEQDGRLDRIEDELYRAARIADGSVELRTTLSDRWLPTERKLGLVRDLLEDRVDPVTLQLVEQVVASPRGRRVEDALADLARLASERHGEVLAEAHVARPLGAQQRDRLGAALERVYGRPVRIAEVLDPEVLGGVRVVVGGEVIDGSIARRLDQARQQLTG